LQYFQTRFLEEAEKFIAGLDSKTSRKVIYNIDLAEQTNDSKLFKKLQNDIWEFRTRYNGLQIRLLAFWDKTNGVETLVPGVLEKTLKAFEWVKRNYCISEYEYIVRSNISTIINFDKLINILSRNEFNYGSGRKFILNRIDIPSGIVDNSLFGLKYCSGTSIILKNDLFNFIVDNREKINLKFIDDVSIGLFLRDNYNGLVYSSGLENYFVFTDKMEVLKNIDYHLKNAIFFRNKSYNRYNDIKLMDYICKKIY
jgi:hypothetical protein